jgi:hypothetical protein
MAINRARRPRLRLSLEEKLPGRELIEKYDIPNLRRLDFSFAATNIRAHNIDYDTIVYDHVGIINVICDQLAIAPLVRIHCCDNAL